MKNSIAIGLILGFGLSVAQAQQDSTKVSPKDDFKSSFFKKAPDSSNLKPIPFQVTFFTPLGTNGWDYEQYETNLSVNIIAGHNGAVNGLEFGGFWNSDRHYMYGLQLAGFGNSVFGDVNGIQGAGFINVDMKGFRGVQGAGFLNHVHENFHGIQLAGFSNSVLGSFEGIQGAGFVNTVKDSMHGVQGAGFINVAVNDVEGGQGAGFANVSRGSMDGIQGAGFLNVTLKDAHGVQGAGFLNLTGGNMEGGQGAGFLNVTKGDFNGGQIAGFLNTTGGTHSGFQAAGFLNVAKTLKGVQLGIINVADSIEGGAQFGLLSFSKNGYKRLDLIASETFYGQMNIKLGMKRFYNIFSAGTRLENSDFIWALGYGLGTSFDLSEKIDLSLEGISYHVNEGAFWTTQWNNLNKINAGLSYKLNKNLAVYGGGSLNIHLSQMYDNDSQSFTSTAAPYSKYTEVVRNTQVQIYPGFNFGISIL